jgi:hypothetical protein
VILSIPLADGEGCVTLVRVTETTSAAAPARDGMINPRINTQIMRTFFITHPFKSVELRAKSVELRAKS